MSTIGAVRISELNTLDTITDGTKIKIPVSKDDSNTSDPDWVSYSVNANVLSYFMENSLGLNDVDSKKGLRSQVIDLQSKFDRTLLRNEVGYFGGEVGLSEGQNLEVISDVPTIETGNFMFCKRIKASTKPIYAGFVYRVEKSHNTFDYYDKGPAKFRYNMPSITGIAISFIDGCAYVVDEDELKKFIPAATTSTAGLLLAEDKTKLNNYASMFSYNPPATTSAAGLMSPADKSKLDACVNTPATPSADGLMTAADKSKLDNYASTFAGNQKATNSYAGLMTAADKSKLDNYANPFRDNPVADNSYAGLMSAKDKRKLDACVISPANHSANGLMLAEDKVKLDKYASTFAGNQKATPYAAGLMTSADKRKLDACVTTPATPSADGLMTSDQVNTLNNALQRVVGYFNGIINETIMASIPVGPLNNGGIVKFCKNISILSGDTHAGFVYMVNNKYYDIENVKLVSPDVLNTLTRPVPFKDGIAIDLSDGCAYVVNSTGDKIEKLIDIPEATDIPPATTSSDGLMTSGHVNKLNNALQRVVCGYFSDEEPLDGNPNIVLTSGFPKDKSGKIVFCKKIGTIQGDPDAHAGFVYMVGSSSDKTYYQVVPNGFSYNMPTMDGIAINLKDGCAYVVDGDELKKFIPKATASAAGLMSAEDKNKLDACVTTPATTFANGLMTKEQVITLNNALHYAVGYFNGIIDQTIVIENNRTNLKNGIVKFCNNISSTLGDTRSGFVYIVNNKYYDIKDVSLDALNTLTHPAPFKDGIAINLDDGCAYVVNSTGNTITKLISEATNIPPATPSSDGLMTSGHVNKLNNALQRVVCGYFSDEEPLNGNSNIVITSGFPENNSGEIVFCKKIGTIQGDPDAHAGFVYRVGSSSNKTYYSVVPNGFSYNMPAMDGIAINIKNGCAYVVDGDELKKFIPAATTSTAGLMSIDDKNKLDACVITPATISANGLMTSDQVNKLNNAIHYAVGYFDEILILDKGQSITPELSSTIDKGGKVVFCNYIKEFGEIKAGFVYKVGGKYYNIKNGIHGDVLTRPVPFEDGIAIKLSDGCAYVFNSKNGMLEKLIDIPEATNIPPATPSSDGLMTSGHVNKLNNALQRVVCGYFSDEEPLDGNPNIVLTSGFPKDKSGKIVFCKKIGTIQGDPDAHAGFVYMVGSSSDKTYYQVVPNGFSYNMPTMDGIAINITDGCAYVVDGDELKKFIPAATTSTAGLMSVEDKSKLDACVNTPATPSSNGLMTSSQVNKLNNALQREVGYFSGEVDLLEGQTISVISGVPTDNSGEFMFCKSIKGSITIPNTDSSIYAGFVYRVKKSENTFDYYSIGPVKFPYNMPAMNGIAINLKDGCAYVVNGNELKKLIDIPPATTSSDGLMTKEQVVKLNNALQRNVGYFSGEVDLSEGQNLSVISRVPTDNSGEFMFCKRIKASMIEPVIIKPIYAGFVYRVKTSESNNTFNYYDKGPAEFSYNMPTIDGIAINLKDGCAYVVDGDKLKKFISVATTSFNGLMSKEDKSKLDACVTTPATASSNGLMTSAHVNKLNNALQRVGYFNGIIDQTIVLEQSSINNKDENKGGTIVFCNSISSTLGDTHAGFVYNVNGKYYYIKSVSQDILNTLTRPIPLKGGIAINLKDGYAYVVNSTGDKIEKLISEATPSTAGLMTSGHVNTLNNALQRVVCGYFSGEESLNGNPNIVLTSGFPENNSGEIVFCKKIGTIQGDPDAHAGFVYRVGSSSNKTYYSVVPNGFSYNMPTMDGIAINLKDGCAYVVNGDELKKLIDIPEATTSVKGLMSTADKSKLDACVTTPATALADGLMLADDKIKLDKYAYTFAGNQKATTSYDGLMTSNQVNTLNNALQRVVCGYFSGEELISNNQNIVLTAGTPKDNSGKIVFCKRIGAIQGDPYAHAGFVYMVGSSSDKTYYSVAPYGFSYNMPTMDGIAINLKDGCAYVVNGNELKKLIDIPEATTSVKGLMSAADKSKLDRCVTTPATTLADGLMTSDQVNTLNNALQQVAGYFNGIIKNQTIVLENSGTDSKNGTVMFCDSISSILGDTRAGFVYMVNDKYYDIKDVSQSVLNALTWPAPFKGGIAINLDVNDGYVYVVNSTGDMITKLISEATVFSPGLMTPEILKKINNIEKRLAALESTGTTS